MAVISRRRALVALSMFTLGPAAVVWLLAHRWWLAAGIALVLLGGYVAEEVVAFEIRDRRAARQRWEAQRRAGGRALGGYTPQTVDRYYRDVERRNGRWAA
jgi:hypothetical protein